MDWWRDKDGDVDADGDDDDDDKDEDEGDAEKSDGLEVASFFGCRPLLIMAQLVVASPNSAASCFSALLFIVREVRGVVFLLVLLSFVRRIF